MSEEIGVSEIIRLAQTEFNLSFSFDVSRMQNLFEQLCLNIQKLQNDINNLKKDVQNKADKTLIEPLEDKINTFQSNEKNNDQESPKNIEKDFKAIDNPQLKPQKPANEDYTEEFNERITKCEEKISDFENRFDELSELLTSELPSAKTNNKTPSGQTRHELFEDLLNELDGTKPKDNTTDPTLANSETKEDNETKSDSEKQEEQNQEPSSNADKKLPHSDDALETFLDAARLEIENAKKLLTDDFGQQMKDNNTKLNGQISKAAADSENGLKKVNGRLIETATKYDTEIKEMSNDNKQQFSNLRENLENLSQKVKALEVRFEANSKAAEMSKDSLKKLVTDDGKIDTEQLFEQLEQHLIVINDMDGRLVTLENRHHVSPDAFNTALQNLSEFSEKVKKVESMILTTDMHAAEMNEMLDDLKKTVANQVTHDQLHEVESIIHDLQDESTNLRDAVIKNNKDIINLRAAINTLRNHSEETRSIAEDANSSVKQACEDVQNNDKRLKKMVLFMQNENGQISTQIKELSVMAERNDEAIAELQKQREIDMARLDALKSPTESYSEEDDETPRSPKAKKSKLQLPSPIQTSSAATSPHLPSLTISNDSASITTPLPPAPQPSQTVIIPIIPPPQATVVQPSQTANITSTQPSQGNHFQPSQTVVKRKSDTPENGYGYAQPIKRGGLPRLAQQQAKRDIESVRMDLKRYEDLIPRVERLESTLSAVKSAADGLGKQTKLLAEAKADRGELQTVFEQFRMALGELNNRIGGIRKVLASKADLVELKEIQKTFFKELVQSGETAAGTETVRCLMCGQPRTNVTGAIDDPTLAKAIGNAVSSRVCGADGQGNVCFVYGEHGEMYLGRSVDGRPIYSKQVNAEEEGGKGSKTNQPPMTAPMIARKILDVPAKNS